MKAIEGEQSKRKKTSKRLPEKRGVGRPRRATSRRIPRYAKLLTEYLEQKNLKICDVARKEFLSEGTLSNVFRGKRHPSDSLLYSIGKGLSLSKNQMTELLFFLAIERSNGSASELWREILKRFKEKERPARLIGGNPLADDLAYIPLYFHARPGLSLGEIVGEQTGILPYDGELARKGAFGMIIPDKGMDRAEKSVFLQGFVIFDPIDIRNIPFGEILCVLIPGADRLTFRTVLQTSKTEALLKPENPKFETFSVPLSRLERHVFGILSGFWDVPTR